MSELLVSLVAFAVVATVSPGGATTLATASGTQFGVIRSIPLVAGLALGVATLFGIVTGGLASVIVSRPGLQLWLRIAGSAYLLWLAWTIGRLGSPGSRSGSNRRAVEAI